VMVRIEWENFKITCRSIIAKAKIAGFVLIKSKSFRWAIEASITVPLVRPSESLSLTVIRH